MKAISFSVVKNFVQSDFFKRILLRMSIATTSKILLLFLIGFNFTKKLVLRNDFTNFFYYLPTHLTSFVFFLAAIITTMTTTTTKTSKIFYLCLRGFQFHEKIV